MKKTISILLAILMMFSCFVVPASAKEVTADNIDEQRFVQYLKDSGMYIDSYCFRKLGDIENHRLYYGYGLHEPMEGRLELGAYTVCSGVHTLDFFVADEKNFYTLKEAFSIGAVNDLEGIMDMIDDVFTVETDPYIKNDAHFLKNEFPEANFLPVKMGTINDRFRVYYNDVYGVEGDYSRYFDGYKITVKDRQPGYDIGLYVTDSLFMTPYSLENAVEKGFVTMAQVYDMLKGYNKFTFEMTEDTTYNKDKENYIQYLKDNELYVDGVEETNKFSFVSLGEFDGYRFYYGEYNNNSSFNYTVIGDYSINAGSDCDFYLIDDTQVISGKGKTDFTRSQQNKIYDLVNDYINNRRGGTREITSIRPAFPYLNDAFLEKLNNYIIELGLGEFYFDVDTTADGYVADDPSTYTYTNLFTKDNIENNDKFKVFFGDSYKVIFQLVGPEEIYTEETIGNYTFTSETFFHKDNPCGYFVGYNGSLIHGAPYFRTLATEIEEYLGMASDMVYANYLPHINNKPEDIQKAEQLLKKDFNVSVCKLVEITSTDTAKVYYSYPEVVANAIYYKYLGDYEICCPAQAPTYDLGLFVITDDHAYTLEGGYENGAFTDLDALSQACADKKYLTFSFKKMDDAQLKMIAFYESNGIDIKANHNGFGKSRMPYTNIGAVGGYTVVAGGQYADSTDKTFVLGDYVINLPTTYELCENGLWIADKNGIYDLEKAYKEKKINDTQLAEICDLIGETGNLTAVKIDAKVEALMKAKFGDYEYNLLKIEENVGCDIYFNVVEATACEAYEKEIGDYRFTINAQQAPYDLGVYACDGKAVYTLEEAWNEGLLKSNEMYELFRELRYGDRYTHFEVIRFKITQEPEAPTDPEKPTEPEKPTDPDDPIIDDPVGPYVTISTCEIKAGTVKKIFAVENAQGKKISFKSKTPKIAKINQNGVVTGLKKGMAKFVVTVGKEKISLLIKVKTDPKLNKKTVNVKKNKTVTVKLTGKVKTIKNVYTNTKTAKITSVKNATSLKIKGLKKGTTTLKVKVNGVKTLKLKVNVK